MPQSSSSVRAGGVSSGQCLLDRLERALAARSFKTTDGGSLTPASVLVPLFLKHGAVHVLYGVRTQDVERHKGEVSFPGGLRDGSDYDLRATALREAWEEVGIREDDVRVLGRLDDIWLHTGFVVSSFVGVVPYPYQFTPNPREVAEVLEVPLAHLLSPANQRQEVVRVDGRPVKMYSYAYGRYLIYGATAWITGQLLELARGSEEPGSKRV